jgi:hypothetical protein
VKKPGYALIIFLFIASFLAIEEVAVNAHEELDKFKMPVRYTTHIVPIFLKYCTGCHGEDSPGHGEFSQNIKKYKNQDTGPRMDTYTNMLSYIVWPDTGAIMRRLDDGKNTTDGKPGNMYQHLGATEEERQKNLKTFKAWIGYWTLKRWKDITKQEIDSIDVKY